jgi:hypothetical protein
MKIEQKVFNELIKKIIDSSINNEATITNVKLWAKSWKKEMKQQLNLHAVVTSLLCVNVLQDWEITEGKKYEMIKEHNNHYTIINDLGKEVLVNKYWLQKL